MAEMSVGADSGELLQAGEIGERLRRLIRTFDGQQRLVRVLGGREHGKEGRNSINRILSLRLEFDLLARAALSLSRYTHFGGEVLTAVLRDHPFNYRADVGQRRRSGVHERRGVPGRVRGRLAAAPTE